jgi:hypothetical protein
MSTDIIISVDPIEIGLPEGEPIQITVNDEPSINVVVSEIGRDGHGVPVGGSTGQVLSKIDNINYNTHWITNNSNGDMIKSTYDPYNISANVYNVDNHTDGYVNKVFTDIEKIKLSEITGTNTGDQDLTMYKLTFVTGILTRGVISVNPDGQRIDITAGTSLYVDDSDPLHPILEKLTWNDQTLLPPNLDTNNRLWIGIQRTDTGIGEIIFSTEFTASQKRRIAILGRVWANGTTTIEGIGQYANPSWGYDKTLEDLMSTIGSLNKTGNIFSPHTGTLTLDKTSGTSFRFSAGSGTDMDSPSVVSDPSLSGITQYHYHLLQTTNGITTLSSTIDPEHYDNAGILTAVPAGEYTIQRVYYFPRSAVVDVSYGQASYATLDDAVKNIGIENVIISDKHSQALYGSIIRSWICVKQGCTDLTNILQCKIIVATNFLSSGTASGGGGGGGAVDSVNGYTGVVTLNPDDLSDITSSHKFISLTERNLISTHMSRHLPGGSDALTTASPVTIGTANVTGNAVSFSRSNHVHDHGFQILGDHHAVVNTTTNGFMYSADKTKLDSFLFLSLREDVVSEREEDFVPLERLSIDCRSKKYYKFNYFLFVYTDDMTYGCGLMFKKNATGILVSTTGYNQRITSQVRLPIVALDQEVIHPASAYSRTPMLMQIEGLFYCDGDGLLVPSVRTTRSGIRFIVQAGSMVEYTVYEL